MRTASAWTKEPAIADDLTPDVFIEEISPAPAIEGVPTSTAGFVGRAVRGPTAPHLVTSWSEFARWHGVAFDARPPSYLTLAVRGFFDNGGRRAYVARVHPSDAAAASITLPTGAGDLVLTALGPGALGSRLFAWVGRASRRAGTGRPGLDRFRIVLLHYDDAAPATPLVDPLNPANAGNPARREPDVTEDFDDLDLDPTSPRFVLTVLRESTLVSPAFEPPTPAPSRPIATGVDANGNRTYIAATGGDDGVAPMALEDFMGATPTATSPGSGLRGLAAVDEIALLAAPDEADPDVAEDVRTGLRDALVQQCEELRDRFAILQLPLDGDGGIPERTSLAVSSSYAGMWHPWVRVRDHATTATYVVPSHGHVAGLYARTDVDRGVHAAPDRSLVLGIVGIDLPGNHTPPAASVIAQQEETLLTDGINVLRDRAGGQPGVRLWGARTLSSDPEWKYVNLRRLFVYIERSIERGIQWVVFEPNSEATWVRLRQRIDVFLTGLWRTGALVGSRPEEAFFVACGRSTMTTHDIDEGRLICEVGIAPLRPAEFVIFRITCRTVDATWPEDG